MRENEKRKKELFEKRNRREGNEDKEKEKKKENQNCGAPYRVSRP